MHKKLLFLFSMVPIIVAVFFISNLENFPDDMFYFEIMEFDDGVPKAVIVDQLYDDMPNEDFQTTVTGYLEEAGYKVDIITTEDVTVDFYKELPSMNYEYIIIRTHSLGYGSLEKSKSALLFTGEKHDYHKYIEEQYLGQVGQGLPYLLQDVEEQGDIDNLIDKSYFVVGSKLVDDAMVGTFPGSTIILSGCETMSKTKLAQSLINRGASEVIGWTGLIDFQNNDSVTEYIIKENLIKNIDMKEVVETTREKNRPYLDFDTQLEYYS